MFLNLIGLLSRYLTVGVQGKDWGCVRFLPKVFHGRLMYLHANLESYVERYLSSEIMVQKCLHGEDDYNDTFASWLFFLVVAAPDNNASFE